MRVTYDLGTRFEIAQHGKGARLNRSVNRNRAAGEIVTSPSIAIPCSNFHPSRESKK